MLLQYQKTSFLQLGAVQRENWDNWENLNNISWQRKVVLIHNVTTHSNESLFIRFQHWDVYNENLHKDLLEVKTGDPLITNYLFNRLHEKEPGVKLFLNEYNIVNGRQYTTVSTSNKLFLNECNIANGRQYTTVCITNSSLTNTTLPMDDNIQRWQWNDNL